MKRLHELHLLAHRAAGGDPLTNLGQERVAQVQIQRNALETPARRGRARLRRRACISCISRYFEALSVLLHTLEVAGSKPAAPIARKAPPRGLFWLLGCLLISH